MDSLISAEGHQIILTMDCGPWKMNILQVQKSLLPGAAGGPASLRTVLQ